MTQDSHVHRGWQSSAAEGNQGPCPRREGKESSQTECEGQVGPASGGEGAGGEEEGGEEGGEGGGRAEGEGGQGKTWRENWREKKESFRSSW